MMIGLFVLACAGAGCLSWAPKVTVNKIAPPAIAEAIPTTTAREAGNTLRWNKVPKPVLGENVFNFSLLNASGTVLTVDDLQLVHEKKMHAVLVQEDGRHFQHLFPEVTRDEWTIRPVLADAGTYHLYLQYQLEGQEVTVLHTMLTIPSAKITKLSLVTNPSLNAKVDGIDGRLVMAQGALVTNTSTIITFELTQHGQPIQEIGPYLGAFGQATVLQPGKSIRYFDLQPQADRQPLDGRLQFKGVFPEAGMYRLYAEFNIAGSMKMFPFVIQVQSTSSEPATRVKQ
jgi:hypothetical protein